MSAPKLPKLSSEDGAANYLEVCVEQMKEQYPGRSRGSVPTRGLLRVAARLAPEGWTYNEFASACARAWKAERPVWVWDMTRLVETTAAEATKGGA